MNYNIEVPDVRTAPGSTVLMNIDKNMSGVSIQISPCIEDYILTSIMREEMVQVRKIYPELDYKKIQEMIDSGDREMNNLADTILREHTKHSSSIIAHFRYKFGHGGGHSMEEIMIGEYITRNCMNIEEELK